jgi:hypothetical protein
VSVKFFKEGGVKYCATVFANFNKDNSTQLTKAKLGENQYYRPVADRTHLLVNGAPFWECSSAWLEQWSYNSYQEKFLEGSKRTMCRGFKSSHSHRLQSQAAPCKCTILRWCGNTPQSLNFSEKQRVVF